MVAEINADRAMLFYSIVELGEPRRAKQSAATDGDRRLLVGDVRSRASRETPTLADHRASGACRSGVVGLPPQAAKPGPDAIHAPSSPAAGILTGITNK